MNKPDEDPLTPTDSGAIEYVVKPDATVVEIRGGWEDFARENAAEGLTVSDVVGRGLWDFVAGPATRMVYQALIDRIGERRGAIQFTFRCDAPEARRFMRMDVVEDGSENIRFTSLLVREEPRPVQELLSVDADRSDVTIVMCSWCKRVKLDEGWVEVEEYVEKTNLMEEERLPQVSHGLCPDCEARMEALVDDVA